jgi:hypothetical protein
MQWALYDAVVVPGCGGPREENNPNSLPTWTKNRLDYLVANNCKIPIILLSAGTIHKVGVKDATGHPIMETTSMATYLQDNGHSLDNVYEEFSSWDTIGNAFFCRMNFTDPQMWRNILILTPEFHLPRVHRIFDWVFSLKPLNVKYNLSYLSIDGERFVKKHNVTISPYYTYLDEDNKVINTRIKREQQNLNQLDNTIKRLCGGTVEEFHKWLFTEHQVYASSYRVARSRGGCWMKPDHETLKSY